MVQKLVKIPTISDLVYSSFFEQMDKLNFHFKNIGQLLFGGQRVRGRKYNEPNHEYIRLLSR